MVLSYGQRADSQQSLPLSDSPKERLATLTLGRAKATPVFVCYWRFAVERQEVFFRRLKGHSPPWTTDPVLRRHRFTNVYRASDRVSQYLIKNVIYRGEQSAEEVFFRTVLFKLFNKIDTWELLQAKLGPVTWEDYDFSAYDKVLTDAMEAGARIYSAAYIMPSGGKHSIHRYKHTMHLTLLQRMMQDRLPEKLGEAASMREAFELVRSYPTIGDFLAYQYITDLNYSSLLNFSEMDFTVAGPGARDGISKCFTDLGGLTEAEVVRLVTEEQDRFFEGLGLSFPSLWRRPIQFIDAQNLFCEVSKYSRVSHPQIAGLMGRTRIKQKYSPQGPLDTPWYPPKWGINEDIERWNRT